MSTSSFHLKLDGAFQPLWGIFWGLQRPWMTSTGHRTALDVTGMRFCSSLATLWVCNPQFQFPDGFSILGEVCVSRKRSPSVTKVRLYTQCSLLCMFPVLLFLHAQRSVPAYAWPLTGSGCTSTRYPKTHGYAQTQRPEHIIQTFWFQHMTRYSTTSAITLRWIVANRPGNFFISISPYSAEFFFRRLLKELILHNESIVYK